MLILMNCKFFDKETHGYISCDSFLSTNIKVKVTLKIANKCIFYCPIFEKANFNKFLTSYRTLIFYQNIEEQRHLNSLSGTLFVDQLLFKYKFVCSNLSTYYFITLH